MYNAYFGFTSRPFASVPQVDQYFPGTVIETARQTLTRCIKRGEGAGMVVGPSGTGKTLLCEVLAEQLKDSFELALLSSGRLSTRRNLFQAILYELGRPYREMDEGELRLALVDHLTASEESSQGMVLLVDEAHTLPLRLFEELRMLTNVARDGRPRVRLVMAGGCVLEERFASPKLDSFSQRLVARCYLESFNRTETQEYVHAQIRLSGGQAERIFPAEACQAVYRATDGIPRLINQVCDHALLLVYVGSRRQVEPAHVEEAWADLQQLPAPSNGASRNQSAGGDVIEFGSLDDPLTETDEPTAEEASLPPLRISPDTGKANSPNAEPAARLSRIEQTPDGEEEEFQPAGWIGPEVELVFEDPFKEQFEKEEVVADRYASESDLPGDLTTETAKPRQDQAAETVDAADRRLVDAETGPLRGSAIGTKPDESVVAQAELERETVPLHRGEPDEAMEPDEEEIALGEENDDDGSVATCSIVAVRRQEYGRLFTKLRRG